MLRDQRPGKIKLPASLVGAMSADQGNPPTSPPSSSSSPVNRSLFQIYYLGSTSVHQGCTSVVMSWVIEELKLGAGEMRMLWLTPGPKGVTYVADNGKELFTHSYSSILRCCTATDRISFAYIFQSGSEQQFTCHVFQALTYVEASSIMLQLQTFSRGNGKEDKDEKANQNGRKTARESDEKKVTEFSVLQSTPAQSDRTLLSDCKYSLLYLGHVELNSPSPPSAMTTVDSALTKMLESHTHRYPKKKRKNSRKSSTGGKRNSRIGVTSADFVDFPTPLSLVHTQGSAAAMSATGEAVEAPLENSSSTSDRTASPSIRSPTSGHASGTGEEEVGGAEVGGDVAIKLTRSTPDRDLERDHGETESVHPGVRDVRLADEEGAGPGGVRLSPIIFIAGERNTETIDSHKEDGLGRTSTGDASIEVSHRREASFYEEAEEVTLEMFGERDEEADQPEVVSDPGPDSDPVTYAQTRRRSVTVLSSGGTFLPASPAKHGHDSTNSTHNTTDHTPGQEPSTGAAVLPQSSSERLHSSSSGSQCDSAQSGSQEALRSPTGPEGVATDCHDDKKSKDLLGRTSPQPLARVNTEDASEYDTLPELDVLQQSSEFQTLARLFKPGGVELPTKRVELVISGLAVRIVMARSGHVLLRRSLRSIPCCGPSKREPDCVGFVSFEGAGNKYNCHVFKAASETMATQVLDSFKTAFVQALSLVQPATLCNTCPLQQLDDLCQSIDGVSTQAAQSRIQECLSSLSEADYSAIICQYKTSEHVDHEFTQLVVLIALLRQHFQNQQDQHTHTSVGDALPSISVPERPATVSKKLSALERAKMALATSFDNLKGRRQARAPLKKTVSEAKPSDELEGAWQPRPRSSSSPRNLHIPVPEPKPSDGGEKRMRSSSFKFLRRLTPHSSSEDVSSGGERGREGETERSRGEGDGQSRRLTGLGGTDKREDVCVDSSGEQPTERTDCNGERSTEKTDFSGEADSGSGVAPGHASPAPQTPPQSPPPPQPGKATVLTIQSFPPAVFVTPVRPIAMKHRNTSSRPRNSIVQRRKAFTPPSGPPPSRGKRGHRRSMSWRQELFESVTPMKERREAKNSIADDWELINFPPFDQLRGAADHSPTTRSRDLWRRAIEQQILLNRMNKQNMSVQKESVKADLRRIKICYSDPIPDTLAVGKSWDAILLQATPSAHDVHQALAHGIPSLRRGEVWQFFIQQYRKRNPNHSPPLQTEPFRQLLLRPTAYETAIRADLGRTFPSHPYFSSQLEHGGQTALYNILHAYAVSDPETGYCQGMSFVAGIILMHSKDEETAFWLFSQLMQLYSYRTLYCTDLSYLQVRLYQLSRLVHDFLPSLDYHLRQHDVTPFFYAASWFLTAFAAQYPIAFASRVLDIFFYEGPQVIFKVALSLLNHHQDAILECSNMEFTSEYLRTALPERSLDNMPELFGQALATDLGNRLQTSETEYEVMDELRASFSVEADIADVDALAEVLKKQNGVLIEQLAICLGRIRSLESSVLALQQEGGLRTTRIERLESEVSASSTSADHTPPQTTSADHSPPQTQSDVS